MAIIPDNVPLTPKLKNAPIAVHGFDGKIELPRVPTQGPRQKLSIVLIVYKMPDQAEKILYSLSTQYQLGITEQDYEVIVVENSSSAVLGKDRACQYGSNFSVTTHPIKKV